ncbi:CBS domain-containing protein [Nonomuraea sp. NPDC046570]|uniref:CBS domain-containing protein n=1 Tax=Nonomuraea sp. NPDC046570 TaxID=3155255 RepID=UPI0033EE5506
MTRVLVVVRPEESPLMAWELMRRAGVHHLPVVDREAHLVGVLTREDLTSAWSGGPEAQSRLHVHTLLGGRVTPLVGPGDPLPSVAAAMLDAGCDAVPVIAEDRGALLGLITARDVLEAVAGREKNGDGTEEIVTGMFRLEPVLP